MNKQARQVPLTSLFGGQDASRPYRCLYRCASALNDAFDKRGVVAGSFDEFDELFGGFQRALLLRHKSSQLNNTIVDVFAKQQFFVPCRRAAHVDSWPDSSVSKFSVENNLGVTRSLEFFEDRFIHFRTCINQD